MRLGLRVTRGVRQLANADSSLISRSLDIGLGSGIRNSGKQGHHSDEV
jgi:hypothetical protein